MSEASVCAQFSGQAAFPMQPAAINFRIDEEGEEVLRLLYAAIPKQWLDEMYGQAPFQVPADSVIAHYNDSHSDEEVIDWYEKALVGIATT